MNNIFSSSTIGAQIFLILTSVSTIISLYVYPIDISSITLIVLGYFLYGCLGIVVTFHRQITHKSYVTYPILSKVFTILGCFAGTGSPLAWAAIHINHHLKSDKHGDPHSPHTRGWRMFLLNYESEINADTKWRMRSIIVDKFHQLLHRYYFLILISWSLLLYIIGGAYLMIFFHWAPAALTVVMSNVVNLIGHNLTWIGGSRAHNLNDQSTNNWIWSILTWGESWHNNHHRYPNRASTTEKWWQLDISGIIIQLIRIK